MRKIINHPSIAAPPRKLSVCFRFFVCGRHSHNSTVPPVRRSLPTSMTQDANALSAAKLDNVPVLLQRVRVLGWLSMGLLSLLITFEMLKLIVTLFSRTEYDYMVYDLNDETQHEIKDNLKIDGWELVTINSGSVIYKRPQ